MQAPWGTVLRCRPLLPFADHFFTASSIELRDSPGEWAAVAALAGVPGDRLRRLHQVHGNTIAIVRSGGEAHWMRPEADGVITDDPSVALVVRVADCAPVLFADRRLGVTAAVHAGWRSTMQRIVPAAIEALTATYGSLPSDLVVAIGPSLGECCGEMGEEVVEAFRAAGHDGAALTRWFTRRPGRRPHFDLWRANREQLEASGVPAASIHVAGLCTRTYPAVFHSYRAAGPAAGRMAAVIRKRGQPPFPKTENGSDSEN
ncbi:peptidoglycan editing factor PgeF [soil metagenome]